MEISPNHCCPFVGDIQWSLVDSLHEEQHYGALGFSFMSNCIRSWTNSQVGGDFSRIDTYIMSLENNGLASTKRQTISLSNYVRVSSPLPTKAIKVLTPYACPNTKLSHWSCALLCYSGRSFSGRSLQGMSFSITVPMGSITRSGHSLYT